MAGQSRKWMILVATIWIQAFTGTNFDFSAYSSELKTVLRVSQVQLNYLATASDLGKAVGWSSGLALMWLPLWAVMFVAAAMGLVGYGLQWLVITNVIQLPYFAVFFLCLLAGCSICWFNTVCFVLCIKNFPSSRPLALALTVSFNGVSAALYNLVVHSLEPTSSSLYLLLNAFIPLFTSIFALIPILRQPPVDILNSDDVKRDQLTFLVLNGFAVITGLYLLFLRPYNSFIASILFGGALFLLILPLCIPGVIYAREWFKQTIYSSFTLDGSGFILVDSEEMELHKELLSRENSVANGLNNSANSVELPSNGLSAQNIRLPSNGLSAQNIRLPSNGLSAQNIRLPSNGLSAQNIRPREGLGCCSSVIEKDQLFILGEDHTAGSLVRRLDFWLYFLAYFCGGTIGLVYSNNLGQIAQSLGHISMNSKLITIYSSFSFFGRLLSAAPDYIRTKVYYARTGWLALALLPTPGAFFLLAAFGDDHRALQLATALLGLSSGFIFAAAVSITSELFGPNSVGVNHNILITNIPIGSLAYGFLAASVYDANAASDLGLMGKSVVCMGKKCYFLTFVFWGSISVLGFASSVLLFLRTRPAYHRFEQNRRSIVLD